MFEVQMVHMRDPADSVVYGALRDSAHIQLQVAGLQDIQEFVYGAVLCLVKIKQPATSHTTQEEL